MLANEEGFKGVYPKDRLKECNAKGGSVVVNLDNSGGDGTHWVACFNEYYFDSYGVEPPTDVLRWMKKNHKEVLYNSFQLQKLGTSSCGWFCIYVIKELNRGISFLDVLYSLLPGDEVLKRYFFKD